MGLFNRKPKPAPDVAPIPATDDDFHKYYSRFKTEILLADGTALCHYGNEANVTVAQMMDGTATEILLDAKQGFEDCLTFVMRYTMRMSVAVIYRRNRAERRWHPVRTYGPMADELQSAAMLWKRHVSRCTCQRRGDTIYITHVEVLSK